MTGDVPGGRHGDHLLAVEELRRALPDDVHIIKEHPMQTAYGREESFFRRLGSMRNVILEFLAEARLSPRADPIALRF